MAKTQGPLLWDRLTKSWGAKMACPGCKTASEGIRQFYPSEQAAMPWSPHCSVLAAWRVADPQHRPAARC
jgi:hypothetical protein